MPGAFLFGAAGYPLLELLYRKRTHYSMAVAGGCASLLISRLSKTRIRPAAKAALGGIGVTAIEFACGLVWNRRWQVWDYRRTPMNWKGQVCLPYSLLWCGLCGALMPLYRIMRA